MRRGNNRRFNFAPAIAQMKRAKRIAEIEAEEKRKDQLAIEALLNAGSAWRPAGVVATPGPYQGKVVWGTTDNKLSADFARIFQL